MAKSKTVFSCQNCGQQFPKWAGQCQECGEWNTLVEEEVYSEKKSGLGKSHSDLAARALGDNRVISYPAIAQNAEASQRFSTGLSEFDRVLGGAEAGSTTPGGTQNAGMVPGAVMLIGGEPGIGKSTILTQLILQVLAGGQVSAPILYICGEESPSQIRLRIERMLDNTPLGESLVKQTKQSKQSTVKKSPTPGKQDVFEYLQFLTTTDVDTVTALIEKIQPQLVVVDSIQTMTTGDLTGAAGSVGQVRESADRLREVAKKLNVPLFLVGHVTKEGVISGPKILEHIVDTVLELTGERTGELRLLRSLKNRFGPTDEVGVFRVANYGFAEVDNPSELFLEHAQKPVPGSATACVLEGTRPLLIEIQALAVKSQLAMPRRVGRGIELSRIQVLSAVLQKHCKLPLGSYDIFVSVAGGFRVTEPAVDLAIAMAIASSLKNTALPAKSVCVGEVGLLGEVRSVTMKDRRVKEAQRLGFTTIISKDLYPTVLSALKKSKLL